MTRITPHISGYDGQAVAHVLKNLAPLDRIEAFDLAPTDDWLTLFALYQMQASAFPHFYVIRNTALSAPVAFCGLTPVSPGMGKAHMLATPSLHPRTAARVARRIAAELPEAMAEMNLHRVDCACLDAHASAASFLSHAGASFETRLECYGKSASPYRQFTWTRKDTPCADHC